MIIDYKQVLLQNVLDCMGMGLDEKTDIIKQAIEWTCLLYTSPSPRDLSTSRMPSSA